jgi:hypothetical protein
MSTRFKWMLEDSIQKGDKYTKIYHGRCEADRDTSMCEYTKNPRTSINYGLVVMYCPENREVIFTFPKPPNEKRPRRIEKFITDRTIRHAGDTHAHKTIRLTQGEVKIIKKNKNIIDKSMLKVILRRDVR